MAETRDVTDACLLALSHSGAVVARNNRGIATFESGSRVAYGLFPGGADIIGWVPVEITPDMVGNTVAVFLAVETKVAGNKTDKKLLAQQARFLSRVLRAGGRAGFATCPEEALIVAEGGRSPYMASGLED